MARYEDPIVKCPFYSWEEGLQMCCGKNLLPEQMKMFSAVTVTFTTKENRREVERGLCKRKWTECPLAQALEKKWLST